MMYYRNPTDQHVIDLLKELLANTYLLYIQTHGAHWNVVGPDFPQLHTLFQTQYEELAIAADLVAEQIRIYEGIAPATATEFLQLATIREVPPTEDAVALIASLVENNGVVQETARKLADATAGLMDIQNLAIDRIAAHGKAMWMLRSTARSGATPHFYY